MSNDLAEYMAEIGKRGGEAGAGKPKKRPKSYYSDIAKLRWKKYRREQDKDGKSA